MLRRTVLVFVGLCLIVGLSGCARAYYAPAAGVSLRKYPLVYVGWVDLGSRDWMIYGYNDQKEWDLVIRRLNAQFQRMIAEAMPERNVSGAQSPSDLPESGPGLIITFSRPRINRNARTVTMAITFHDRRDGKVVLQIPGEEFKGDSWAGIENDLWYSLDAAKTLIVDELRS